MGRSEDGRPGAYTSSIKADGYGAPHKLSEHTGMPQATANAGRQGNMERFQTFLYCGKMREREINTFLIRLSFLQFHCLKCLKLTL